MSTSTDVISATASFVPWADPLIDARGFDPRGRYVERFWLSVIGPTAGWIVRRIADGFDERPDGFELDLAHTAASMGLSYERGPASPFGRALHRCVMFGVAHPITGGFAVRRRLPEVARRHLVRLPSDLQDEHLTWISRTNRIDQRHLEQRLREAGISPAAAACASETAARLS